MREHTISYDPSAQVASPVIRCEGLCLSYRSGHEVLGNVTLNVPRGSFHFITGASGAGKSSLISLFALALRPTRGNLYVLDHNVGVSPREQLPFLRRRIGIVYQDFRLIEHLSVEDNVALPLRIRGEPAEMIRDKVMELLSWMELEGYQKMRPEMLSGGQKQRVAIARAVIAAPDILLADEPSGNLDSALSLRFMYLFEALNKTGATVIYATHDEGLIARFRYPVLRLQHGQVLVA